MLNKMKKKIIPRILVVIIILTNTFAYYVVLTWSFWGNKNHNKPINCAMTRILRYL